jgi:hypothetical protein
MSAWITGAFLVLSAATAAYSGYTSYQAGKEADENQEAADKIAAKHEQNAAYAGGLEKRRRELLEPTKVAGLTLAADLERDTDQSRIAGQANVGLMPSLGLAQKAGTAAVLQSGAGIGGARDMAMRQTVSNAFLTGKASQLAGIGASARGDDINRKMQIIRSGQQTAEFK